MTEDTISSTPPLTPPTTEEMRASWLRLLRSRRVGISTFYRLLNEHGSAEVALEALPDVARAAGAFDYQICPIGVVEAELRAAYKVGAQMICYGDPRYPKTLMELEDAPPLFWAIGDTALLARPKISIVGARNASSLGERMARKLAAGLSEQGFVVVSGLARGIDAVCHDAALKGGTIAVQAGGVDKIYPRENTDLFWEIGAKGLRISEDPIGLTPQARHFPKRNRIISGLSRGLVVVEAAARSGTLITARNALDQGRDVMAVPGHPFDARSAGSNMLLRDGATMVRHLDDVLEQLSGIVGDLEQTLAPQTPQFEVFKEPPARTLSDTSQLHQMILNRLGPTPLAEDQLIRDLNLSAHQVSSELVTLEIDGHIERASGGLLTRVN
ncbi:MULTISPECIES: DNA-processing protein DprA [Falsihalocynthiibacter]|uniref:DNA-processing protein DprA n=1 Tax=Falsihalocynthiibacter TaxID=2854182 RepID=UPI003001148F